MMKTVAALIAIATVTAAGVAFSQTTLPSCEANGVCARLDQILAKVSQPPVVNVSPTPVTVQPAPVTVNNTLQPIYIGAGASITEVSCSSQTPSVDSGCSTRATTLCTRLGGYNQGRVVTISGNFATGVVCFRT